MCLTGHNNIFKEYVSPDNKRYLFADSRSASASCFHEKRHKIAPFRQAKNTYINKERIYLTNTEVQNSDSGQNQNQIPTQFCGNEK